jgi:hypothetical protein
MKINHLATLLVTLISRKTVSPNLVTLLSRKTISPNLGPMFWFLKYFPWKFRRKNCRFLLKTKLNYSKIITLVFEKNANFFRRKLSKIAENCDHNIDPWSHCLEVKLTMKLVAAWIPSLPSMSSVCEPKQSRGRCYNFDNVSVRKVYNHMVVIL